LGSIPLISPLTIELERWGLDWTEFAFGPGDQVLVQERIWRKLQDHRLAGVFANCSIKMSRHRVMTGVESIPPEYCLLTIEHSDVALDSAASGLVFDGIETTCPTCGQGGIIKRLKRVSIVPTTWQGQDFFFAKGLPGVIVVSDNMQRRLVQVGVSTKSLIPSNEFGFDHYPWEAVTSHSGQK
jgi:hypothetical protein